MTLCISLPHCEMGAMATTLYLGTLEGKVAQVIQELSPVCSKLVSLIWRQNSGMDLHGPTHFLSGFTGLHAVGQEISSHGHLSPSMSSHLLRLLGNRLQFLTLSSALGVRQAEGSPGPRLCRALSQSNFEHVQA